jgi:nicotinamidase-related amidase
MRKLVACLGLLGLIASAAPAGAQVVKPKLMNASDAVLLMLDHQTGLFQTVHDIPVAELRNNAIVLAKAAGLAKVPVITTASEPKGPNGPLMPELAQAAPNATYVGRHGEVSAWDNPDFVKAVQATGKKTLIMAGVWTSVCVVFPALQAKAAGYDVYAVIDASGDVSPMASQVTVQRLAQAGVIPTTANAVVSELQRTWNRPDAAAWAELYGAVSPNYRAAIESYQKAQDVAREPKQ